MNLIIIEIRLWLLLLYFSKNNLTSMINVGDLSHKICNKSATNLQNTGKTTILNLTGVTSLSEMSTANSTYRTRSSLRRLMCTPPTAMAGSTSPPRALRPPVIVQYLMFRFTFSENTMSFTTTTTFTISFQIENWKWVNGVGGISRYVSSPLLTFLSGENLSR